MSSRNDLRDWISEQQSCVEQAGGLTALVLFHFTGTGADQQIFGITAKSPPEVWKDADRLAQTIDDVATRHAKGMPGSQQYELRAAFGDSAQYSRFHPFQRLGNLMGVGPQGLGTEPPTEQGMKMQGMRLLEQLTHGTFASLGKIMTTQEGIISKLVDRLDRMEQRADDRQLANQKLTMEMISMASANQVRQLMIDAGRKMLPLLPAAVSSMTGNDSLIPQAAAENSVFDMLVETFSQEQLLKMLGDMQGTGGEAGAALGAVVFEQLDRARKRKEAREQEKVARSTKANEAMGIMHPVTPQQAETELVGKLPSSNVPATKILAAVNSPNGASNGSKSHEANGKSHDETVVMSKSDADELINIAKTMESLLEGRSDAEVEMAIGFFGAKNPQLGAQLRELHKKIKK